MQKKKKSNNFTTTRRKIEGIPGLNPEGFLQSCDDLINFCAIIDEQNETNQQLLRNSIKIRLVSIIEFNLKGFVSGLIDLHNLNPKNILDESSISLPVDLLQNFKSDQITKGKIIVAHLDKMNPGTLYSVMSKINKLDSFRWIDRIYAENGNVKSGDFFHVFKNLYKDRNDITHNLIDVYESTKTLKAKIHAMKNNIFALYICTNCNIDMFEKNLFESKIDRDHGNYLKKLQLDQKQFKDITTKFRKDYKPFNKKY